MANFLLYIFLAVFIVVGLMFMLRGLMKLLSISDRYFTARYPHISRGFLWGFRLPTKLGVFFEYYFYLILGKRSYSNYASWPIKFGLMISVFLFISWIISRSFFANYFSIGFPAEQGLAPYYLGGFKLWFLHLITFSYLILIVFFTADSIRMVGYYAPVRILILLLALAADIIVTFGSFLLAITATILYLAFKFVWYMMSKSAREKAGKDDGKQSRLSRSFNNFLEVREDYHYLDIINVNVPKKKKRVRKKAKPAPKSPKRSEPIIRHYDDDIPGIKPHK